MGADAKDTEARLTILEYRQDKADESLVSLRQDYQTEHAALRKSLQGIERNLATIKYVAIGAGLAFLSQAFGLEKAFGFLKAFL